MDLTALGHWDDDLPRGGSQCRALTWHEALQLWFMASCKHYPTYICHPRFVSSLSLLTALFACVTHSLYSSGKRDFWFKLSGRLQKKSNLRNFMPPLTFVGLCNQVKEGWKGASFPTVDTTVSNEFRFIFSNWLNRPRCVLLILSVSGNELFCSFLIGHLSKEQYHWLLAGLSK